MNHLDWVGVLVKEICEMGKMLKEYISPAFEKFSSCLKEGQSDSAAVGPIDVTTIQVAAEPQGQSQPAAVAPVEAKKPKMKSKHLVNKDKKGGSSLPAGETEVEITTESLLYESL
ncbi:hypothetical protein TURU_147126 [Turdus rufiventris]|nr:hypothetical protein TURU_147126 [Turdus rufiventris]